MKEMDIVIISYSKNQICKDLTHNTLTSLFESEDNIKFNVFVVESQEGVYWEEYTADNFNVVTLVPEQPYGYHKFLNFGRKAGNSDFVALCNNDLIFTKKWASRIFQASDLNPSYFSFSPMCPKTQIQYGLKINRGFIKGYEVRVHISGWCIIQKRSIYNIIGDLDESFIHWYCDNDYAMTLKEKKINHMLVTSSLVYHHNQTIGKTTEEVIKTPEELEEITKGAEKIFKNKWGL